MEQSTITTYLTDWDPLSNQLSPEVLGSTIKRQIKNILKSYTGWYDPLSELIQNALDAIDTRKKLGEIGYTPKIWIKIDMKENLICVTDNGIGFTEQEFQHFLVPNVSYKDGGTRGNKGVGATYIAYGFNFLQIGTKKGDFEFIGTIKDGREWVEDVSHVKNRPVVRTDQKAYHEVFKDLIQGSTFVLKFNGNFIYPKDLTWLGAHTAKQWNAILRIKTPLGGIYFDDNNASRGCSLTVIDSEGNETQEEIDNCTYIFPNKAIHLCKSLEEIKNKQMDLISKGKDASKLSDGFYKLNGLYLSMKATEILSEKPMLNLNLTEKERELIKNMT